MSAQRHFMDIKVNSLVLYHNSPAIIQNIGEKINIKLENGKEKKVRLKDINILCEGPIPDFSFINEIPDGDIDGAWSLLQGEEAVSIQILSELIYNQITPATVWQTYQILNNGEYFTGTLDAIISLPEEEVLLIKNKKLEKLKAEKEFADYIQRVKSNTITESDLPLLKSLELLALNKSASDRTLKTLGIETTPENAQKLLLNLNLWPKYFNPFPLRAKIPLDIPHIQLTNCSMNDRKDLTYMDSYAIDELNCNDPDDALSFDNGSIWIHVADVAAFVSHNSQLDTCAKNRGSNLYLPEKIIPMLPQEITQKCGLGLNDTSPALSFKITLDTDGNPHCEEITPSIVKVKQISYTETDTILNTEPFKSLFNITEKFHSRRIKAGGADIYLPEVKLKVNYSYNSLDNENTTHITFNNNLDLIPDIEIIPIQKTKSRQMVTDAMLMAGEAVADWLHSNHISAPFASQIPPEEHLSPETLSEMFQYRKQFKRTQINLTPAKHAGLGLNIYTRVTSPLRRYSDLLVHQQLRAFIAGKPTLEDDQILEKITYADEQAYLRSNVEKESNLHWKLVKMQFDIQKTYSGIVVDKFNDRVVIFIPYFSLSAPLRSAPDLALDSEINIKVTYVDLISQNFRIQCI